MLFVQHAKHEVKVVYSYSQKSKTHWTIWIKNINKVVKKSFFNYLLKIKKKKLFSKTLLLFE